MVQSAPHFLDGKQVDVKPAIPKDKVPAYDIRHLKKGMVPDSNPRKIFVGGIAQTTFPEQQLKKFFSQFGPVHSIHIMMDKATGRSRGFGFIEFESEAGVDAVFREKEARPDHPFRIHGHIIDVKRAFPRAMAAQQQQPLQPQQQLQQEPPHEPHEHHHHHQEHPFATPTPADMVPFQYMATSVPYLPMTPVSAGYYYPSNAEGNYLSMLVPSPIYYQPPIYLPSAAEIAAHQQHHLTPPTPSQPTTSDDPPTTTF